MRFPIYLVTCVAGRAVGLHTPPAALAVERTRAARHALLSRGLSALAPKKRLRKATRAKRTATRGAPVVLLNMRDEGVI